jgi:hypothetical protein
MSFHGVALFEPAGESFIENLHVAVTIFVENAISQTGQVTRATSIKDYGFIFRYLSQAGGDLI